MSRKNLLVVGVCCVGLSACNTMNSSRDYSYETSGGYVEAYQGGNLQTMPGYAYAYSGSDYVNYREEQDQMGDRVVTVPETYHVGAYHSPVPAKDRDRNWVSTFPMILKQTAFIILLKTSDLESSGVGLLRDHKHAGPRYFLCEAEIRLAARRGDLPRQLAICSRSSPRIRPARDVFRR